MTLEVYNTEQKYQATKPLPPKCPRDASLYNRNNESSLMFGIIIKVLCCVMLCCVVLCVSPKPDLHEHTCYLLPATKAGFIVSPALFEMRVQS